MTIKEFYDAIDADYNDAVKRLMNENLVLRFVMKFPADPTMENLRKAVETGNIEDSFRAVHTLKGVAGNLAFTKLFEASWNLTEQLRPRAAQADKELYDILVAEYDKTLHYIAQLQR